MSRHEVEELTDFFSIQGSERQYECYNCHKITTYRGQVAPKCTCRPSEVTDENHQDQGAAKTKGKARRAKKDANNSGATDSDTSTTMSDKTSDKMCSELKLWRQNVEHPGIVHKAERIKTKGEKVNKKMCDNIATVHTKTRELNSSIYCQPSFTVTVNLPSQTYQVSGDRYLADMFLTNDNMAKIKQLGAEGWPNNKRLQKDKLEVDPESLFPNYITLQIPMMSADEFNEIAMGRQAVDNKPGVKANPIRAKQLITALAKANNLKQGKGKSAQCA